MAEKIVSPGVFTNEKEESDQDAYNIGSHK